MELTITLPPEMADRLAAEVARWGKTPEEIAVWTLGRALPMPPRPPRPVPELPEPPAGESLYDYLDGYIGVLDSSDFPRPADYDVMRGFGEKRVIPPPSRP